MCRAFVAAPPDDAVEGWYAGPNFRYEKPQRGRYRQFDQVDVEVLGVDDPYLDVEVIALGWRFFEALGLRQVTLLLNSLGEPADRARYVEALRAHFGAHARRAQRPRAARRSTATRCACSTPSAPRTPPLIAAAAAARRLPERRRRRPTSTPCAPASTPSAIPYTVEPRLVRGLDYYLRTTFEFAGGTLDSAQNALGGGGRYDGLVEALGGPPTPGHRVRPRRRPHAAGVRRRGRVRRRRRGRSTCSSSTPPAAREALVDHRRAAPRRPLAPTAPTTAAA